MKKNIREFLRRGLAACGLGPLILAVLYLIMEHQGVVQSLTVDEVCLAIFSLSALAFVAGGMNFIYQIERIPLMLAILIHGLVLYVSYLGTYLVNGWLERGIFPVLVFTGIFLVGYLLIWAVIYIVTRKRTERLNHILKQKQRTDAE
ncbi:MAG: DUF3021 domain-containing protein [Oscillospiraceae bacterium]|nr:DUF3021 domain-containing protein [Oscillospiraceae bacterium]